MKIVALAWQQKFLTEIHEDHSYTKRGACKVILSGQGIWEWVMMSHPKVIEKVIEMKVTLGTGNECSIATGGRKHNVQSDGTD